MQISFLQTCGHVYNLGKAHQVHSKKFKVLYTDKNRNTSNKNNNSAKVGKEMSQPMCNDI